MSLESTIAELSVTVDYKAFTESLTPSQSTLTQNRGEGAGKSSDQRCRGNHNKTWRFKATRVAQASFTIKFLYRFACAP